MDVNPTQAQDPASGDDELAKVLAGVSDDPTQVAAPAAPSGLQFEETPAPQSNQTTEPNTRAFAETSSEPAVPAKASKAADEPTTPASSTTNEPTLPDLSAPLPTTLGTTADSARDTNGGLDDIKKSALEELRPLVDKLNLSPEEKFDTILLIIRSTDDHSLVETAYESAKSITDETKRAQALLDVIKEIDYFATKQGVSAQPAL